MTVLVKFVGHFPTDQERNVFDAELPLTLFFRRIMGFRHIRLLFHRCFLIQALFAKKSEQRAGTPLGTTWKLSFCVEFHECDGGIAPEEVSNPSLFLWGRMGMRTFRFVRAVSQRILCAVKSPIPSHQGRSGELAAPENEGEGKPRAIRFDRMKSCFPSVTDTAVFLLYLFS